MICQTTHPHWICHPTSLTPPRSPTTNPDRRVTKPANVHGHSTSLPARNSLTLTPCRREATFAQLVRRLVTFHDQESGEAMGVIGLRLAFTQDHTILIDTVHGGRITLAGVREHEWTAVISKRLDTLGPSWRALTRPDDPVVNTYNDSGLLLNLGNSRDQVTGKLLSAILRRPRLLDTKNRLHFVDLWDRSNHDTTQIEIEWSGDLPHGHVINRFTDPLFGLPLRFDRDEFYGCVCDPCLYLRYSVALRHTDTDTDAVIHLRRSSLYDDEPNRVCDPKAQTLDQ